MQSSIVSWIIVVCACASSPDLTQARSFTELGLGDSLLQEMMARMGGGGDDDVSVASQGLNRVAKEYRHPQFRLRQDGQNFLGPSLRDQEFLQHSSLWGHQYMQGGAGEGNQMLKPDGSVKNMQVVKSDAVLPAYCNPPNPCPLGYTTEDGCLEEFENTAAFSREYQAAQECMCDSEHMFDCPGTSQDSEIDALARSIQNEGLDDTTLDRIVQDMQLNHKHKVVAKKYFSKERHDSYLTELSQKAKKSASPKDSKKNPFLQGEPLPVVAKKSPT